MSEALARVQTNIPLFNDMTTLQLREFMIDSDVHAPGEGEIVFSKDDYTNSFYSILEGEVLIDAPALNGDASSVSLGRGQFFGEIGLLSGRRRTATSGSSAGAPPPWSW